MDLIILAIVLGCGTLVNTRYSSANLSYRRVYGGSEVPYGSYNYIVRLEEEEPMEMYGGKWYCPSTVIHVKWVLTSAACLEDVSKIITKTPPNVVIKKCLPKEYVFSYDDPAQWMKADIALAEMQRKFEITPIRFACTSSYYQPGVRTWILGFNMDTKYGLGHSAGPITLWKADASVYPMASCQKMWPEYQSLLENYMVCTNDDRTGVCQDLATCKMANGTLVDNDAKRGFCQNDHGGPLLVKEGNDVMIIGVVSNMLLDKDYNCVGPFIYTRTDKFMAFISCVTGLAVGDLCLKGHNTVVLRHDLV